MSSNLEKYKKDLENLIKAGEKILDDFYKNKERSGFLSLYHGWYTESREVIKQLIPDRLGDFQKLYKSEKRESINFDNYTIQDWLLGIRKSATEQHSEDFAATIIKFRNQLWILESAKGRFESSLFNIKQLVQADLFDSELDAARELNKKGFTRGTGAIVGVVLEKHLAQVCENHKIKVSKKDPSINDFNQLLKDNDVIEIEDWRFIQHLADLRNLCDHDKKREPKKEEIEELINGVEKIMKTIF